MKFPKLLALTLTGLLSGGATLAIAEYSKPAVDRAFPIEDIAGDPKHIDGVEFENIIKTGHNAFEKVNFGKKGVEFEKTEFDIAKAADEKVLANKDVYRGTFSPAELETSKYIITAEFNVQYPYNSKEPYVKVAIKDKKTGKVINETVPLQDFTSSENIWEQILMESEGKIYYSFFGVNGSDHESVLYIYELDPRTAKLRKESISVEEIRNRTNLSYDNGILYTVVFDEPGSEHLLAVDLAKKTAGKKQLSLVNNSGDMIESITALDGYLYVQMSGNIYIIDAQTSKTTAIVQPTIKDQMDYLYATEIKAKDGLLYILFNASKNEVYGEYISVYDNKNGKVLYEGKLPGMDNRGVNREHVIAEID